MVLILSGQFWNCPDSFKTVWILISLIQARKFTDLHWTLHSRYLINIKVNDKHCIYAFLHHFIFNTTREMITHFDMFTYFYTSRERFTHFFICRERRLRIIFLHVAKSGSARFVRKIFAREKPLSGKFWVFVPMPPPLVSLRQHLPDGPFVLQFFT